VAGVPVPATFDSTWRNRSDSFTPKCPANRNRVLRVGLRTPRSHRPHDCGEITVQAIADESVTCGTNVTGSNGGEYRRGHSKSCNVAPRNPLALRRKFPNRHARKRTPYDAWHGRRPDDLRLVDLARWDKKRSEGIAAIPPILLF